MLYEYLSLIFGIIKIYVYKIIYFSRISFKSIPKMNNSFKIAVKKKSKLIVGKNFRTRNNVSFRIYNKGNVSIGDNCFFNDGCSVNSQKKITIGNNLICGQNVMFFDHDHDYKNDINNFVTEEIIIGNNVWIGANCTILKGVTIGNNVVIAAGTLIKDDVPSDTIVYQEKNTIGKKIRRSKNNEKENFLYYEY